MANIRMSRINGELQKALADVINNRLNNPDLDGLIISVVDVDTTPDLSMCKVAISVLSGNETKKLAVQELNRAKNFIRHEVMRIVRLKSIPEFVFELDESYEKGQKLLNLIDKISKGD